MEVYLRGNYNRKYVGGGAITWLPTDDGTCSCQTPTEGMGQRLPCYLLDDWLRRELNPATDQLLLTAWET